MLLLIASSSKFWELLIVAVWWYAGCCYGAKVVDSCCGQLAWSFELLLVYSIASIR